MGEQINTKPPTPNNLTPAQISPPIPAPLSPKSIDADASTIYNYHRMHLPLFNTPTPSKSQTAIFTLCSLDTRVAHRAATLFLSGYNPLHPSQSLYTHLIFSGNVGALTSGLFSAPEAEIFAAIASSAPYHIPSRHILIEPRSTNTGENVRFTYELLRERGLLGGVIKRFVLVQKPYMERRTYATFVRQWPGGASEGGEVEFTVTSPLLEWDEYPDAGNPRELVISIMVGDLVRIKEYSAKGFQIEQEIPDEVWEAGQRLILAGYGGHLP